MIGSYNGVDVRYWSDSLKVPERDAPMVAVNHARAHILSPWEMSSGA